MHINLTRCVHSGLSRLAKSNRRIQRKTESRVTLMILQVTQLSHTIHVNLPYMDGWYVFFFKERKKKANQKPPHGAIPKPMFFLRTLRKQRSRTGRVRNLRRKVQQPVEDGSTPPAEVFFMVTTAQVEARCRISNSKDDG